MCKPRPSHWVLPLVLSVSSGCSVPSAHVQPALPSSAVALARDSTPQETQNEQEKAAKQEREKRQRRMRELRSQDRRDQNLRDREGELFIDERRPIEDFYDDWTATHEFSHLMLPFVRSPHRWISEGFAQYYQNVLLTRAGQYDERRAWQKLYEGFERGRKSRPELSPNEAAERGVEAATMKIYWSGAIIALLADVELRQRSDGRESLDFALDRLQRCCLPAATSWSGTQLFEKLDSFVTQPVFMPLYDQYADTRGFPDIVPIFERLGVEVANDRVSLRDDAELTEIRRAITEIYSAASKE